MKYHSQILIYCILFITILYEQLYPHSMNERTWQIETIDDIAIVKGFCDIAFLDNTPWVSYYDVVNEDLIAAYKDDSGWHSEVVYSKGDVGLYNSIIIYFSSNIKSSKYPVIYFYDASTDELKRSARVEGIWSLPDVIDTDGNVGLYVSAAGFLYFKDFMSPHIGNFVEYFAYYDATLMNLKFGVFKDKNEVIDDQKGVGRFNDLIIDGNFRPHISYYDAVNKDLKYARRSGSDWIIETVDENGYVGTYTSISLLLNTSNSTDNYLPQISYYDATFRRLKFAGYERGKGFYIDIVDDGNVGQYSSIVTHENICHISYYDAGNGDLKYAFQTDKQWNTEVVDSEGDVGAYSSIAVSNENLYILYVDMANNHIKIAVKDISPNVPDIVVEPLSWDYGSVEVGDRLDKIFVVLNEGNEYLNVNSTSIIGDNSSEFSIGKVNGSFTVPPLDFYDVTVEFIPVSPGDKNAMLRIISDDPDKGILDIPLSGAGTEPEPQPEPNIKVEPGSWDYGGVEISSCLDKTFVVSNTGDSDLNVDGVTIEGIQADQFMIIEGGGSHIISPSDFYNIVVEFVPTSIGDKSARLRIISDDPDENIKDIGMGGTGIEQLLEPNIEVNPASWDYDSVAVDSASNKTFVVSNTGSAILNVNSICILGDDSSEFSIANESGGFNVSPLDSHNIIIEFAPILSGIKNGIFRIISDDPDEDTLDITLAGTGVALQLESDIEVNPSSWDYGDITVDSTSDKIFVISNSGKAVLNVNNTDISGIDSAQFSIKNGSGSLTVLPDSSHKITVEFSPIWSGIHIATLDINSDDPTDGTLTINLKGTGKPLTVSRLTKSTSQPSGGEATGYRLISVPLDLDNSSIDSVLLDDLGYYNDKKWRLFDYIGGLYVEYPNVLKFIPGRSLWLIVRNGATIDCGAGKLVSSKYFSIPLYPGWNIIANPYNQSVPVENLSLSSGEVLQLWYYDGAWDDNIWYAEPWEGYAALNDSIGIDSLLIDPGFTSSKSSGKIGKATFTESFDWRIQIEANCGKSRDPCNILGVSEKGASGWDRLDRGEPPQVGKYVSVYFDHPEWNRVIRRYCVDCRPLISNSETWDYHISTNIVNTKIELTFSEIESIPEFYNIVLMDKYSKTRQNLRLNNSYQYYESSGANYREFSIVVGRDNDVEEIISEYQVSPVKFQLSEAFPNPFNTSTMFYLMLSQTEYIKADIYSLTGKRIKGLINNEAMDSGCHRLIWDGKNQNGESVSSGIYFLLLKSQSIERVQRKVLLIK